MVIFQTLDLPKIDFMQNMSGRKILKFRHCVVLNLNDFVFQEGEWVWESNGDPFGYTSWGPGQGNNVPGYCLYIFNGDMKWNYENCNWTRPKPLCQIDG